MNIAFVGTFPPFRGGIAHFNSILANHLNQAHKVRAFNFTTQYPALLFPGETQFIKGKPALNFPSERLLSSVNPASWWSTAAALRRFNPDLIILKFWMPFFAPAFGTVLRLVKRITRARVMVICDNIVPHESRRIDSALTRYFLDQVDYFIVMSKAVENDLLRFYPAADYRFFHHPLYDIFGDPVEKNAARQALGITAEKVLLYFGYIRRYKGLDLLIEAAARIRDEYADMTIVAAGECYEDPARYVKLVREKGVEDIVDLRLQFIPDEDIRLYFSAADAVVLPYRSATQSGIVPIAYHFEKPVIVTDVGGLPEIVMPGETGIITPVSADGVADGIRQYYSTEIDYHTGIRSFKQQFSWDGMVKIIEGMTA